MTKIGLSADCARCASLCCVVLAFDKGRYFAEDKAACEPCRHLGLSGCKIYDGRSIQGYAGCLQYDCFGAGQRVTQDIYQGADWRDDPALLEPMARDFVIVQRAHRALALLRQAQIFPLTPSERSQVAALEIAFLKAGASPERVSLHTNEAHAFIRRLSQYVRPAAERTVKSGGRERTS